MGVHGDRHGAGLDQLNNANAALGLRKYIASHPSVNVAMIGPPGSGKDVAITVLHAQGRCCRFFSIIVPRSPISGVSAQHRFGIAQPLRTLGGHPIIILACHGAGQSVKTAPPPRKSTLELPLSLLYRERPHCTSAEPRFFQPSGLAPCTTYLYSTIQCGPVGRKS
jgi:hypothetical protein